jgi:hypothetical protein
MIIYDYAVTYTTSFDWSLLRAVDSPSAVLKHNERGSRKLQETYEVGVLLFLFWYHPKTTPVPQGAEGVGAAGRACERSEPKPKAKECAAAAYNLTFFVVQCPQGGFNGNGVVRWSGATSPKRKRFPLETQGQKRRAAREPTSQNVGSARGATAPRTLRTQDRPAGGGGTFPTPAGRAQRTRSNSDSRQ